MPSGSYIQVYVKCPFYLSDNGKNRIICEGAIPGSQIQNFFRKRKDFKLQTEIFCCQHYANCEIHETLRKKYEEESE